MKTSSDGEELIERAPGVGALSLGASQNRSWIELFYEGDHTHIRSVELPGDIPLFDIFVEEIPHKTTVYEHPRVMVYFTGPCDIEICRDGNKIIVRGCKPKKNKRTKRNREKDGAA